MATNVNLTKLIDAMAQILAQKNNDIAELVREIEILEEKLAKYKEKELFELVGTSSVGDQVFNVYEKFVPDFVTDEEIAIANLIAPKFDVLE